jgi:2-polyprenyl-3-methyl-5-hydroxy-6-metoxy-1,4-benzoquinol methylase
MVGFIGLNCLDIGSKMMTTKSILSPLTSRPHVEKIRDYDSVQLTKEWSDTHGIDISDELQGTPSISKYRCLESGLTFYTPATSEGSGILYEGLSKFSWYYTPDKWEHFFALHFCRRGMRILEVGCGGGEFLTKAADQGCDCIGLEINPRVHADDAHAVEIRGQALSECAAAEVGSFDLVCAFQVLEHTAAPKQFLLDCLQAAKKGGIILLGTPNSESFLQHSHNLLDLPPHHMSGWSSVAYKYLEKILPMKLIALHYEPLASYHYKYFIETYRSHFARSGDWREWFFTGYRAKLLKKLLSLGVGRLIRGQCMIAVFQKY